MMGLKAERKWA